MFYVKLFEEKQKEFCSLIWFYLLPMFISLLGKKICEKTTAVYENKELLIQAQVIAAKWWKMGVHHIYKTIVFDGPVID